MNRKAVFWAALAVVGLPVCVYLFLHIAKNMREGSARSAELQKKFFELTKQMAGHQWATIYAGADPAIQHAGSLQQFVSESEHMEAEYGNLQNASWTSVKVDPRSKNTWYGEIESIEKRDHGTFQGLYRFRYSNGEWKLLGYRVPES